MAGNFGGVSARRGCISIVYINTHWRQISVQLLRTELSLRRLFIFSVPHPNLSRHYLWLLRFSPPVVGCSIQPPSSGESHLFLFDYHFLLNSLTLEWSHPARSFGFVASPFCWIFSDLPRLDPSVSTASHFAEYSVICPISDRILIFIWIYLASILRFRLHLILLNLEWSPPFSIEYLIFIWIHLVCDLRVSYRVPFNIPYCLFLLALLIFGLARSYFSNIVWVVLYTQYSNIRYSHIPYSRIFSTQLYSNTSIFRIPEYSVSLNIRIFAYSTFRNIQYPWIFHIPLYSIFRFVWHIRPSDILNIPAPLWLRRHSRSVAVHRWPTDIRATYRPCD